MSVSYIEFMQDIPILQGGTVTSRLFSSGSWDIELTTNGVRLTRKTGAPFTYLVRHVPYVAHETHRDSGEVGALIPITVDTKKRKKERQA